MFCSDVDATGRVVEQENAAGGLQSLADCDRLLSAAGVTALECSAEISEGGTFEEEIHRRGDGSGRFESSQDAQRLLLLKIPLTVNRMPS